MRLLLLLLYCQGRAVRAVAYRMLFYNPHTGTYNDVYVYICALYSLQLFLLLRNKWPILFGHGKALKLH